MQEGIILFYFNKRRVDQNFVAHKHGIIMGWSLKMNKAQLSAIFDILSINLS